MSAHSLRVVIVDNYDSYAWNLFQRIGELTGAEARVVRNDQLTLAELEALHPTHVVISPGPGNPEDPSYFGICREVILTLGKRVPVLGVCLGHQGIGAAFGGRVVRAPQVMHGKTSRIRHDGTGVFSQLPDPCEVMRYHSLMIAPDTMPPCLRVTARTEDGIVMGVEHRELPIHGVQFHPESIGTPEGTTMLANFLRMTANA